jgi:DMSO/TMAO reductase YedYZ molybdopterin-dependent catalytic subunit
MALSAPPPAIPHQITLFGATLKDHTYRPAPTPYGGSASVIPDPLRRSAQGRGARAERRLGSRDAGPGLPGIVLGQRFASSHPAAHQLVPEARTAGGNDHLNAGRGCGRLASVPQLPPGQRRVGGFPRFGGPSKPPTVPASPALQISGAVREPVTVVLSELSTLPRTEQTSDFHCVAGWSATGLRWEGVGFTAFYRSIIEPQLSAATTVTHLVFCGLDGYRAIVSIDDALQEDVLLADRLGDEPLRLAHGAPLRLVSPQQYGYLNAKHLCAIEIHTSAPPIPLDLILFRQHPRARVWQEERNGLLPATVVRPIYRSLIRPFMRRSARGNWN